MERPTDEHIRAYTRKGLIQNAAQEDKRDEEPCRALAGRRYVLANSDSCPPRVEYEKFLAVTDEVNRFPHP